MNKAIPRFEDLYEFFIEEQDEVTGRTPKSVGRERAGLCYLALVVVVTVVAYLIFRSGYVVFVGAILAILVLLNEVGSGNLIRMTMTQDEIKIFHLDGEVTIIDYNQLRLAKRVEHGVYEVINSNGKPYRIETEKLLGIKEGAFILFRDLVIRAAQESGQEVSEKTYLSIPEFPSPRTVLTRTRSMPTGIAILLNIVMLIVVSLMLYVKVQRDGFFSSLSLIPYALIPLFLYVNSREPYLWVREIEVQADSLLLKSKKKVENVPLPQLVLLRSTRVDGISRFGLEGATNATFVNKKN